MGLSDALRNRLALARGESLGEALRIFLASKHERRRIAARKFPGQSVLRSTPRGDDGSLHGEAAFASLLDASWYARTNALPHPEGAWDHFVNEGLAAALAPMPALAGSDGRHLSPRGAEFLHRLGLPIGAGGEGPLDPSDPAALDPWGIRNPADKPLAVVTAVATLEHRLGPVPPEWTEKADFLAITDLAVANPGAWRLVRPVFHHREPERRVVFAKTHLATFFPGYARVLWVDPGVILSADPGDLPAASGDLACYRLDGRTVGAEAAAVAASGEDAADAVARFVGEVADHPGVAGTGLLDPRVLLVDPGAEPVRRLMARWWGHVMRGSHADRLSLSLAVADTPGLIVGDLPGQDLDRSGVFARRGSA